MDIISLPQSLAIVLLIAFVASLAALLGDRYAVHIKEEPLDKTWLEVVIGTAGSEFFIFLLSEGTFWILGILHLAWWIPIAYPALIYAITGGFQIWRQEQKIKADKLASANIKTLDDLG